MTRHTFKTGTFASASILAMAVAGQAQAVTFEQQMSATYQPTFFDNFDFDGDRDDGRTFTSAGAVDVGDEHVRGEIRWGATVTAGKTTGKFLLESDSLQDATFADGNGTLNLERAYFTYEFNPALVLQAGHEFKLPDFGGGGLLYGDDHPIFGVMGDTPFGSYDAYAILIDDSRIGSSGERDSTVWLGEFSLDLGSRGTVKPIVAFHDNQNVDANITYFGGTFVGGISGLNITAEAFGAVGGYGSTPPNTINFRGSDTPNDPSDDVIAPAGANDLANDDISSFAANMTLEFPVADAFKPNIGFRWTSGDDDPFDDDLEGWLGISDISGFVGPMSSGHSILRWGPQQNAALSAPVVFGSTFETSGPAEGSAETGALPADGSSYGGIGNSGTGTNPGQIVIAPGATGSLTPSLSYQASLWFMWYDETAGLEALPDADSSVDDYAGTQLDIRLDYALTENFTVSASGGVLDPGDGVKDATGADDLASLALVEMKWSY